MKTKFKPNDSTQLLICYWNPNGTNDLLVMHEGDIVDCIPEATFGINVDGPEAFELEPDLWVMPISYKRVIDKRACSPVMTPQESYNRLYKAIGGLR